jgi:DNA polymerase III epsilon subunit-like protein
MVLKNKNAKKENEVKELPKTFVVIDFETTGVDPKKDRIVEVGAVRFTEGEPVALFNCMVKQDLELYPLSAEMQKITGHTPEDIAKGLDEELAMLMLFDFIGGDALIVGQNILFDWEFLTEAMCRHWDYIAGANAAGANAAGANAAAMGFDECQYNLLDTLTIGRERKPYPHRLPNLCKYYGVEQSSWHSAYYDAVATGELALAMHAEDKYYAPGKQVADYINVIGFKRQYGEPTWVPSWVTLKPQGNVTIKEGK